MAAPFNPPIKNEEFIFYICLESMASPGTFKNPPTVADGDFTVGVDGAASANVSAYDIDPDSTRWVKITLSAAQMNGDCIRFLAADQTSPPEWGELAICIETTSS